MKRLLALAAIAGVMMSAAVVSTPVVSAEVPAHCAILPLLKAECRAAIRAAAEEGSVTVVSATTSAASTTANAVSDAVDSVTGWRCVRNTGGKSLYTCSR